MQIGDYDFNNTHQLRETDKFIICHINSKFNENDRTWTVNLPDFFYNNPAEFRQITINTFIYFRPDGTSDVGTTFHSADLFDNEYVQSELDYFVGMSGTSIAGTYSMNSRKRTLTFWFKDYRDLDQRYGVTETYKDPETGEDVEGAIKFYIQAELSY